MFLVGLILLFYAGITFVLFEHASRRLTGWMPRSRGEQRAIARP